VPHPQALGKIGAEREQTLAEIDAETRQKLDAVKQEYETELAGPLLPHKVTGIFKMIFG
jgi:hypothetical protein